MSSMKIGWAEVDITPDKKIALAGQFAERISEYVEKPLTATAMAVECGDDQMVLVSFDLSSIGDNLLAAIRENLGDRAPGLDPDKLMLAAIHTHTGPVYSRREKIAPYYEKTGTSSQGSRALMQAMLPPGRKYVESAPISNSDEIAKPKEVLALLVERGTDVVIEAWNSRKEGSFTNAFGRAPIGMCRRATYSDGSAQMWGDTNTAVFDAVEGGNDSGIELMYVFDGQKKLTGVVVNLACPAQCVQHRLFVSPDFWGETKKLLREHFGEDLFMLPLCSAAGDQCPVDLVRWVEPYTDVHDPNITRKNPLRRKADPSMFDLDGMKKAGRRIANEVIGVYEEGLDEPQTDIVFEHRVRMLQLPLRRATLADVANARRAIREFFEEHPGDVNYDDTAKLQVYLGILKRFQLQELLDIFEVESHIIRMGSIAIATNPFELFLDYGNQIKARAKCEQTFLIQLCNGAGGYLPTEKAEKGGHYSAFIASGKVGHAGGEQLVRETLREINSLFAD